MQPRGARADREPSAAGVLALDGEQALHGRDRVARGAPGEQLRGQPPRERAHAATGALARGVGVSATLMRRAGGRELAAGGVDVAAARDAARWR